MRADRPQLPQPLKSRQRRQVLTKAQKSTLPAMMLASILAISGCQQQATPRSYLALPIKSDGSVYQMPYVIRTQVCGAEVLAVGVEHGRTPNDPLFASLEDLFDQFSPTLVLHESTTPRVVPVDRVSAIQQNGEIGLMQYLASEKGVEFRSGDMPEAQELPLLLADIEPQRLLVFLTQQRLLTGSQSEAAARAAYPDFYRNYLVDAGFPNKEAWSTWEGFLAVYREVVGRDRDAASFEPEFVSPIRQRGPLNTISRQAHEIRDRHLASEILRGAKQRDARVMVVFGAWHVLTLEPVLKSAKFCDDNNLLSRVR